MGQMDRATNQESADDQPQNNSTHSAIDFDATLDVSISSLPSATGVAAAREPQSIGPYQLIHKLGEGGMGQVWLAEQTAPVKRTVAVKLIRVGRLDDEVLQRFQAERQSLAVMDHPTIAKVFDAGSTSDGQPYFVMEYVPGVPITQYCDRKRLSIKHRLELFIKVCEGVQHAHQKAIIHRDLKPANILVADVDGKPVPRIIDFGVAKATRTEVTGETMMTRVGGFVGTPGYMSPEQADGTGDIDTRSDVYSLGVILYVLLTGTEPFDTTNWRQQPFHEVLRQLREAEPSTPSSNLRSQKASSSSISQLRGTHVKQLEMLLRGDLDWITMKALEKDRVRRYGTPMELAGDLNRYLNNQPVLARPASTFYRLQKYVRRHRVGVTVAAGLVLLLIAFAATQAAQLRRLAQERDRANRNAEIAEKNRSEATKQAQLALDTIYQVVTNTDEKIGVIAGTGSLRKELLESAMKNLDNISRTAATSTWADRTTGVALQRMAAFYEQMGMTKQETEVLDRSLQIFNRLMREDPSQDWNAFDAAISYDTLGEMGRETEPDPGKIYRYYELARQLRQPLTENIHQEPPSRAQRIRSLAVSYVKLSMLAVELHNPSNALNYAQQALSTSLSFAKIDVSNDRELLPGAYLALARARLLMNQENEARDAYGEAEQLRRAWVQSEPINAHARQELARADLATGEMELEVGALPASLDRYRKAETIFTELISKDPGNVELKWYLSNTQYALGRALQLSGKQDESKVYFRLCLTTRKELFRADSGNIQRRIELMLVNAQLGNIRDALSDARVVEQYAPQNPGKLFSAACAYALAAQNSTSQLRASQADNAIRVLQIAVASNFRDTWALQRSPELQSLRGSSAFQQLLREFKTVD